MPGPVDEVLSEPVEEVEIDEACGLARGEDCAARTVVAARVAARVSGKTRTNIETTPRQSGSDPSKIGPDALISKGVGPEGRRSGPLSAGGLRSDNSTFHPGIRMRAMVTMAHGDRGVLALRADYPDPAPAPDEVIVRVAATALNRQDIRTRLGTPGIRLPLPLIAGSDIAGEVVGTGRAVRGWSAGDRVLIDPAFRDGRRIGLIGETADGGRAEYVVVPAAQLLTVPDAVSLEDAAALPLAYGTAHRMLARGRVVAGDRVLVLGASGGVGVATVQLAKTIGAEVVACAGEAWKMERLQAAGADFTIHTGHEPVDLQVASLFGRPRVVGGGGVDVAVNLVGGDTWGVTQRVVTAGGRILTTASSSDLEIAVDPRRLWSFEHEVIGSHGWAETDLETLLGLVAVGRLDPMIDRILPLERTAEGERLLEEREVVGKVLIRP